MRRSGRADAYSCRHGKTRRACGSDRARHPDVCENGGAKPANLASRLTQADKTVVFFRWLNDSGHASTTRTRPSAGFFVSGWRFALARLAPEAGNTPVSNRIIPPSVEGYAEGYVLNVGLEGGSQNRQGSGFSFLVPVACLHALLALTRCLHEAQKQKGQPSRIGLSA
jgi:hypothetical protein